MVEYELKEGVAVIRMDDGKANALSHAMLDALGEALDQAESDKATAVLQQRQRVQEPRRQQALPGLLGGVRAGPHLLGFGREREVGN